MYINIYIYVYIYIYIHTIHILQGGPEPIPYNWSDMSIGLIKGRK